MNTSNPFQIPTCLQRADLQQRRRERFKQSVVAIVAGIAALLVVLLIQGCMSEHAKTSSTSSTTGHNAIKPSGAPPQAIAAVQPKPAPVLPAKPVVAATPVQPEQIALPAAARTETVYVVKSGDTLSRIAKLNQTTVKALKAANDLESDTITVGTKLKLPSA